MLKALLAITKSTIKRMGTRVLSLTLFYVDGLLDTDTPETVPLSSDAPCVECGKLTMGRRKKPYSDYEPFCVSCHKEEN